MRTAQRRVVSKIEAKITLFDPPPSVKMGGGMARVLRWYTFDGRLLRGVEVQQGVEKLQH